MSVHRVTLDLSLEEARALVVFLGRVRSLDPLFRAFGFEVTDLQRKIKEACNPRA